MTEKQFDHICNILTDLGDHFYTEERFDTIQKCWSVNLTEVLIVLCNEIQQSRNTLSNDLQSIDHKLSLIVKNLDTMSG